MFISSVTLHKSRNTRHTIFVFSRLKWKNGRKLVMHLTYFQKKIREFVTKGLKTRYVKQNRLSDKKYFGKIRPVDCESVQKKKSIEKRRSLAVAMKITHAIDIQIELTHRPKGLKFSHNILRTCVFRIF